MRSSILSTEFKIKLETCKTGAYQWTHQRRGCLCLEPLSSGRCPAAPSSARESARGTGESWWLGHKARAVLRGHAIPHVRHGEAHSRLRLPSVNSAATLLLQCQAAVCDGVRLGDNDKMLLIDTRWEVLRTEAEEDVPRRNRAALWSQIQAIARPAVLKKTKKQKKKQLHHQRVDTVFSQRARFTPDYPPLLFADPLRRK